MMLKFDLKNWEGKKDCHVALDKLHKEELITFIIMMEADRRKFN